MRISEHVPCDQCGAVQWRKCTACGITHRCDHDNTCCGEFTAAPTVELTPSEARTLIELVEGHPRLRMLDLVERLSAVADQPKRRS